MKIGKSSIILWSLGALVSLPLVAGAVIYIGNNTGTAEERCDRFCNTIEQSYECHSVIWDAEIAKSDASLKESTRNVEQSEQRLQDIDAAIDELNSRR